MKRFSHPGVDLGENRRATLSLPARDRLTRPGFRLPPERADPRNSIEEPARSRPGRTSFDDDDGSSVRHSDGTASRSLWQQVSGVEDLPPYRNDALVGNRTVLQLKAHRYYFPLENPFGYPTSCRPRKLPATCLLRFKAFRE